MFRQFARLPLHRCLHSRAGSNTRSFVRDTRSFYALGASITLAGYLAFTWGSNSRHISLDSEAVSPLKKQPSSSKPPRLPDASTSSLPQSDASEPVAIPLEGQVPSPAPVEGEGEQEEPSGGAFDPETGKINWDCPCLGGMAHGPCGQQFREAFSCFVHSEADPKGIDCVEKFRAMQECFREHPDVYGDEIMDDDDDESPAASPTTDETGGDLHPSDSHPPEVMGESSSSAPP